MRQCVNRTARIRIKISDTARVDFPHDQGAVERGNQSIRKRCGENVGDAERARADRDRGDG